MNHIFHIGYPKTASIWLQYNFFPYIKNATYVDPKKTFDTFITPNPFDFDPQTLQAEYQDESNHLIFSNHAFIGTNYNFGLNGFLTHVYANRIKTVFSDAKVIVFIRNQTDIIASAYLQYIKEGGTYGIRKYLYHNNFPNITGYTLFSLKHFEYNKVLGHYAELFGRENIFPILYEAFATDPVNVLNQLCDQLDIEFEPGEIDFSRRNVALRRGLLPLARFSNHFSAKNMLNKYYLVHIPGKHEVVKKVLNRMNRFALFGPHLEARHILKQPLEEEIKDHYRSHNRELKELFPDLALESFNYPL
jgi:hypothetical protein